MKEKILAASIYALIAILVTGAISFIAAIPVYLLWNWVMPEVFGLPVITYWQAWGIAVLADTLFHPSAKATGKETQA